MDTSSIIAIALGGTGFIISIIGLVVTPLINLKSKKLEKRLEFRFHLFQKILELWEFTHNNQTPGTEIKPILLEINKFIQLYGYNTEIKLFREVTKSYNQYAKEQTEINKQKLTLNFNNFLENSFNTYRNEIILETLEK